MYWPLNTACNAPYDSLFNNDWGVISKVEKMLPSIPLINGWHETLPDVILSDERNLEINYVDWLIAPQLYKSHQELWNPCLEKINELEPIPALKSCIQGFVNEKFLPKMIGVHIRRGDFVTSRPEAAGNTKEVLKALDSIVEEHPSAGILLCTDDGASTPSGTTLKPEGIVTIFQERYGSKIRTPRTRSLDRNSLEAIQDALVTLMLLRKTDIFIGTEGSTFSHLSSIGRNIPFRFIEGGLPDYRNFIFKMKLSGLYYIIKLFSRIQFGPYVPFHVASKYYSNRAKRCLSKIVNILRS